MKHFYKKKYIKNSNKIIILCIGIIFFDLIIFNSISNRFSKNIINIIKVRIDQINKYHLNRVIKKYLNINTNDYIKINLVNNNIVNVDIDSYSSNKLLKEVINDLENNVNIIEKCNINNFYNLETIYGDKGLIFLIPIGVIYNNSIISGLGPKIPIRATFSENIESYIDVEVKNYGINNSIIKLYIIINIRKIIMMPTKSNESTIKYKYLLSSKLINGKVPDFLGNGINESYKISK